ncbi:uncharacterized protein A4U43_C03F32280 [Asparagus officinalis]|uniref:Uncharacterized protein n=2 Tax=Asparagus officinalis TaxID=4686 RepID=A0A5P1FEK5_ASPOF|nr:uncharacterized protein LOC109835794 isoform X2 [Asparagus officinalis]XP_020259414.1 uncharacterized protein LOC109835794 isoform X2 [Asparagus officinalis]XP_020259415.1 uncharacterized protein LOC109835794 isoform X2 [Asparagus officinalis]ONK76798.1 uncharacterized protein A4U43_C03F32280 [Asparagus officinalis]
METLVVVAEHRNQYYSRSKSRVSNHFGSSPSRGFKGINCRTFETGVGILPPPHAISPSSNYNNFYEPQSPCFYAEPPKSSKRSNPIAICPKYTDREPCFNDDIRSNPISPKSLTKGPSFNDDIEEFAYSELWAGPAYSNSPPPSSLPIPKFSLRQKRSVSLELPLPSLGIELPPIAKSAPSTPSRESFSSATENLRRILHLDIADN